MMNHISLKRIACTAAMLTVFLAINAARRAALEAAAPTPSANAAAPAALNPVEAKHIEITAEDLRQALGTHVYRWVTDLQPGDWYTVSLKMQLAADKPPENLVAESPQRVSPSKFDQTFLTVSFLRMDHIPSAVLGSNEKECEFSLTPSGAASGGFTTFIRVPLQGIAATSKMIIVSPDMDMFAEPGATTLLVICTTDPATHRVLAYPRATLTLRHVAPPQQ